MKGNVKREIMDRLAKGQTAKQIAVAVGLEQWHIDALNADYWRMKYEESQNTVRQLKRQLGNRENMQKQNTELRNEIAALKNKLEQLQPAIESVNSLTAERSKLIRKLKRAGIKV